LKLRKTKLGADHPDTLTSMNNLAMIYQAVGKRELALPLFVETLGLNKAKLGADHPDTLTSMNNLGMAYQAAGKVDLALSLLEETLTLRKANLGPEHPDTLATMNNLATAYWGQKQFDKAIPLFEETLKGREANLGRNHPYTLMTMANLGVTYKDAGRLGEALPLLEEAYRAANRVSTLGSLFNPLLEAYTKLGDNAKIANLLAQGVPEARKSHAKDSPQLADMLAQVGSGLLEQHKGTEAEPFLRECLAIRVKRQPDAWTTGNTKSLLGGALLSQQKYAEAEPLLLTGYEEMKKQEAKIPPQGQVRLTEALVRLVQLHEATDQKGEAAKWRKELDLRKEAQERLKLENKR
jgi:tetratricopeptide (TPR) repeat protein